jgi:phosphoribosylformimino-5-aminoimidazole carboxamide ribotide isomerase
MDTADIFSDDPVRQAGKWQELGAARIHIVDLDGSVNGRPVNRDLIRRMIQAVQVPVQIGGGIRDRAVAQSYLDIGADCVIIGTAAVEDKEFTGKLLADFPGRVAIGIDAVDGIVSVRGWTQSGSVRATELAAEYDVLHPKWFIYTDIARDGMMRGPNIEATEAFARETDTPVILSGGISAYSDIEAALPLAEAGVAGIIIGRALYEEKIDLARAHELVKSCSQNA